MNIKSIKEKSDQLKSSLLAEIENDFLNLQAENCALLKDIGDFLICGCNCYSNSKDA